MAGKSQTVLRQRARELGIKGYSKYNTAELKALVIEAQYRPRISVADVEHGIHLTNGNGGVVQPVLSHGNGGVVRLAPAPISGNWVSFESEVERQGPKKKIGCSVAQTLNKLPKEGERAVKAALAREEFSGAAICRALRARGVDINSRLLAEHRRGACKCQKPKTATSGATSKTR